MTDEEKIKAVTAKLARKFYVGQRVRVCNYSLHDTFGKAGTVKQIDGEYFYDVLIDGEDAERGYVPTSIELLL